MRIPAVIKYLALAVFLSSCDQQQPVSDIDPELGIECFESQRASFPPGTQYEGIAKLAENRLTIKIMNGVDVVMIDCALNSDGALESTGSANK